VKAAPAEPKEDRSEPEVGTFKVTSKRVVAGKRKGDLVELPLTGATAALVEAGHLVPDDGPKEAEVQEHPEDEPETVVFAADAEVSVEEEADSVAELLDEESADADPENKDAAVVEADDVKGANHG
jgi:hypothetical protein